MALPVKCAATIQRIKAPEDTITKAMAPGTDPDILLTSPQGAKAYKLYSKSPGPLPEINGRRPASKYKNEALAKDLDENLDKLIKQAELWVTKLKKKQNQSTNGAEMDKGDKVRTKPVDLEKKRSRNPNGLKLEIGETDSEDHVLLKLTSKLEAVFSCSPGATPETDAKLSFASSLARSLLPFVKGNQKLTRSKLRESLELQGVYMSQEEIERIADAVSNSQRRRSVYYEDLVGSLDEYTEVSRREMAAVKVQSKLRGFASRKGYEKKQRNIIGIQRIARGKVTRSKFQQKKQAATQIQSVLRGKNTRGKSLLRHRKEASVKIQSAVRGKLGRGRFQQIATTKTENAIKIQSAFRGTQARQWVQEKKEKEQEKRTEAQQAHVLMEQEQREVDKGVANKETEQLTAAAAAASATIETP